MPLKSSAQQAGNKRMDLVLFIAPDAPFRMVDTQTRYGIRGLFCKLCGMQNPMPRGNQVFADGSAETCLTHVGFSDREKVLREWARNSAVEYYLHTVGVTGSNPVAPTKNSEPRFGVFLWAALHGRRKAPAGARGA